MTSNRGWFRVERCRGWGGYSGVGYFTIIDFGPFRVIWTRKGPC